MRIFYADLTGKMRSCGCKKKLGVKRHRSNNEQYRQQSNTRPTEELIMKLFKTKIMKNV